MQRVETRTGQLGLVGGIRQEQSDLITVVEPASPFSPETRKGKLFLVVEADGDTPWATAACQLVARAARRSFYEDSTSSITSALRKAIRTANKALYEQNFNLAAAQRVYVGITCAVLREGDLFVTQVQPAQAYVVSAGQLRALPAHPAWDPAHTSVAPFTRSGALGASLFIEPELYRCTMVAGDAALVCSSNFAPLLGRAEIETLLHESDPGLVIEQLQQAAVAHGLDDAHALFVAVTPTRSPTARLAPRSLPGVGERSHGARPSVGARLTSLAAEAARIMRGAARATPEPAPQPRPDPLHTLPEEPPASPAPMPRPAPLDLGPSLDKRYEQSRRAAPDRARPRPENLPPSSFLGEDAPPGPGPFTRRIDLADPEALAPGKPYRPRYEARPLVDLSWGERLALPFRRLKLSVEHGLRARRSRRGPPPAPRPIPRGQGLSYRRTRAPFPWVLLIGLVLVVAALIFYGLTLTRQNDQQLALEYFAAAEERLVIVREADDEPAALAALDLARQAIEEIRASPNVTDTNPVLWLRYQELFREYERALAAVQRLTFFESPTVLASHPSPTGLFATLVVPPALANITDTTVLEGLRYLYALDAGGQNARLYRIPRDGGAPQSYLNPGQAVGTTVVGPVRAALWRIDQVVAVDEAASGYGYYFRNAGAWNYSKLGASEIWSPRDRLDVEEYGGNLYVWGAQPNEVLRFRSGSYGDTPDYWLDQGAIQSLDLSTVVDMAVDGSIYLLRSDGTVLVFSQGQPVGEITPEQITPPITAVTRFFITGTSPEDGHFFLLDTLNERVIQLEKVSGNVIQQIKVRPDGDVQLDQLANLVVDSSGARPVLYLVNAGQIIRAELPAPPRSFRESGEDGTPVPMPTQP